MNDENLHQANGEAYNHFHCGIVYRITLYRNRSTEKEILCCIGEHTAFIYLPLGNHLAVITLLACVTFNGVENESKQQRTPHTSHSCGLNKFPYHFVKDLVG